MVQSWAHSLMEKGATTFGGDDDVIVLGFDMFSAEESGIDGPCSRPDHCGCAAQCCQDDRNPRVTRLRHRNPNLDHGNQRSHEGRPESDKEK
jgi:hypothetical protein